MQSFEQLLQQFEQTFNKRHFPEHPASLYDSSQYILGIGGKRVRPVMCLMGNELFDEIQPDAWDVGTAIELFHNFSLIHDDIMDAAPLRRGVPTVHANFGTNTAILAGDVMLIMCYEYLNKVQSAFKGKIIALFNKTALEVSEGQQLDMDFERKSKVTFSDYEKMIELKTSVLLAASLKMGAIIGGASAGNASHLYEFGKNLGIAFQVQDDYLDAFGDPERFGKQLGGDILANKKTFLMIHALENATGTDKDLLHSLMSAHSSDKVNQVLTIFRKVGVDEWALKLKKEYLEKAFNHLEAIAVSRYRKEPLEKLAHFLVQRDH